MWLSDADDDGIPAGTAGDLSDGSDAVTAYSTIIHRRRVIISLQKI